MGGHGGLNILPQKKWNVYNYENREKVRRDEEAAAREEQLKREESRKRDAEFRLERLRAARGLVKPKHSNDGVAPADVAVDKDEGERVESEMRSDHVNLFDGSNHINLFDGIKIFDPIKENGNGKRREIEEGFEKRKKMKKEESVRVVTADDEKYRLGYGLAGKGVKLPWYLEKKGGDDGAMKGNGSDEDDDWTSRGKKREEEKSSRKKSLQELREERLKREKREKERERALLLERNPRERRDRGDRWNDRRFSRR